MPVVKANLEDASEWYVRLPFIWLPPAEDPLEQLQKDWEEDQGKRYRGGAGIAVLKQRIAGGNYL